MGPDPIKNDMCGSYNTEEEARVKPRD